MSRIGKLPIEIPKGVKLNITDTEITVEGPKGKLTQDYKPEVKVFEKDNCIYVERKNDMKQARSYHGLYRSLINNMITGVSSGFSSKTCYRKRCRIQGRNCRVNPCCLILGYSMQFEYPIPEMD